MRGHAPFKPEDLQDLDVLLDKALAVVPMRDIAGKPAEVIGLRHDVDNVIEPAVEFAMWEQDRGYRSTYYILHTAPYWTDDRLLSESLDTIAACGHEIGIHNNALAESTRTGQTPEMILSKAIEKLGYLGHPVTGTVAHGDPACYDSNGTVRFVNDQLFRECERPTMLTYRDSVPLTYFGLTYDANWITRAAYLSDSGGVWSKDFDTVRDGFPYDGQLHMLVHPDWWAEAFETVEVPA